MRSIKMIIALLASTVSLSLMAAASNSTSTAPTSVVVAPGPTMTQQAPHPHANQSMHCPYKKAMANWDSMTPEQRAAFEQRMKTRIQERWANATPAQKAAMREQLYLKMESLPPEERQALLEKLQQMHSAKNTTN